MSLKFEPVLRFIGCFDGNLSKAASALGVANSTLTEWRDRQRPVPVKKAVLMEQLSGCKVSRMEFFPDDGLEIWPELRFEVLPHSARAVGTQPCAEVQIVSAPPAANDAQNQSAALMDAAQSAIESVAFEEGSRA